MRFWVGAYTGDGGAGDGIGVLQAGDVDSPWASGPLGMAATAVREPGSPSWLAPHPSLDVLYAALEGDGTVRAYRRTGETTLAPLGGAVVAGESVCHVAVSPDGRFLLASCWGDGRVVRVGLGSDGRPGPAMLADAATDPYGGSASAPPRGTEPSLVDLAAAARALREAAGDEYASLVPEYDREATDEPDGDAAAAASEGRVSRAHESIFLTAGLVATTDLGFDLVRFWRNDGATLRLRQEVALPRGSGPRHGVWHPSGHLYVVTELSREVFVLAPDREGRWSVISGIPLAGTLEGDTAAELAASRDGTVLYAGVRGSDTVAAVAVRGAGESLQQLALAEAGTHWPRHHLVARDTLLVAGQLGDEIVSLPLDERTGVPGRVRHRTPSPSPTRLLPVR